MSLDDGAIYQASLIIKGDALDPSEVSSLLNAKPTRCHRKGHTWQTRTGNVVVEKTGFWSLEMRSSTDLEGAIRSLCKEVHIAVQIYAAVPAVEEAYFDIFVSTGEGAEDLVFSISAECLGWLGQFDVPICFTASR